MHSPLKTAMKIGHLDHVGYGNLGDATTPAIVLANIKKHLPASQLVGLSILPYDIAKKHGTAC